MANEKGAKGFTLPADMVARLKAGEADISKAEREIAVLETLGMNMEEIKDRLAWAKKVRETLIKEFA